LRDDNKRTGNGNGNSNDNSNDNSNGNSNDNSNDNSNGNSKGNSNDDSNDDSNGSVVGGGMPNALMYGEAVRADGAAVGVAVVRSAKTSDVRGALSGRRERTCEQQ